MEPKGTDIIANASALSHLQWPSGAFSVKRSTLQQRSVQYSPFKASLAPFLSLSSFHPCSKRSSMPHIQGIVSPWVANQIVRIGLRLAAVIKGQLDSKLPTKFIAEHHLGIATAWS